MIVYPSSAAGGNVPGSQSADGGTVALAAADMSKAITFGAAFAAAPAVQGQIILPNGSSSGVECWPDYSTLTAAGVTFRFGSEVPASGYYLTWTAVGA